jgi:hypothetical protein
MRRNALLALGNRDGVPGPRELDALALGLIDKDPQVVAAAERAARRRNAQEPALQLAQQLRARLLAEAEAAGGEPADDDS